MKIMKKQLSKLLGAGALSFAAMSASMSVSAVELASTQFSCPPDVGLTECYAGSVLGKGSDTSFLDLEIGSFTVADAMADVLGFFDTKWLKLTSLTLSSGESSFTADGKHGDVAFEDLAAGTYTVSISGMLNTPTASRSCSGMTTSEFASASMAAAWEWCRRSPTRNLCPAAGRIAHDVRLVAPALAGLKSSTARGQKKGRCHTEGVALDGVGMLSPDLHRLRDDPRPKTLDALVRMHP